jgi:NADH-quinone oxidoreductase subunit G
MGAVAAALKDLKGEESRRSPAIRPDVESMFSLKKIMDGLGSPNIDCRQDGAKLEAGPARATCSTRPSPGSSKPTRCC